MKENQRNSNKIWVKESAVSSRKVNQSKLNKELWIKVKWIAAK